MAAEDGVPVIEHLRAYERQTGEIHPMLLDAPALPEGSEDLWRIFNELHRCRGASLGGPLPVSYLDIDAFQRVTGIRLAAWELDAIRRADAAYLADWHERQPKPNP